MGGVLYRATKSCRLVAMLGDALVSACWRSWVVVVECLCLVGGVGGVSWLRGSSIKGGGSGVSRSAGGDCGGVCGSGSDANTCEVDVACAWCGVEEQGISR